MNKKEMVKKLKELGFELQKVPKAGYMFLHEDLAVLYMPEEQDEKFVRFAVPNLYDVTEENRQYLMEMANETNVTIKYGKVCIYNDYVWACSEHRCYGNEDLEELIGVNLSLLHAMVSYFCQLVENGGVCIDEDNTEEKESEETDEQDV